MKFTLNNFYSNNYKDFIHLEALKNVLRKVPRLKLAGIENIDNILSMEFSVDDWGENPMYIKYIDTGNKEHIVKIRPSVTEQIYEILKAYAKISYVDEQDKKLKDELHTEIMQGDENTLNLSKTYTDTVVNHARDEINHTIETTKQELKNYCDNKCEIILASSKEYTDTKAHELNKRIDDWTNSLNSKVEKVNQQVAINKENIASNSNRITTVSQLVTANDNKTTQALADVNIRIDNLPRSSEVTLGGTTFKERLNIETDNPNDFYSTVTLEQRDGSEPEVVGRLVKGDVAKKVDLDLLSGKVTDLSTKDNRLSEIPKTGKATYINWYPDTNITYIRLVDDDAYTRAHINKAEGLEQVVYWPKSKITGVDELKTNVTNLLSWKTNVTDELTQMNETTERKTSLYTTSEGEANETRYPRATFKKLRNGDISFNPGAPTDPTYGYLLNEAQLTKLKNLNETPAGTPTDIKFNTGEDVTGINFLPGNPDKVIVSTARGLRMNASFITQTEKTNIANLVSWKTNVNEVIKKVDDLDIGGTNLLWGTDTYVNDFWTLPVSNGISHGERQDDGLLSQSIHIWGDDNKAKENMATNWRPIHLIAGHQYTISLQARYYEPNRADTKVTGRNIRVFSDYTDVHEPEGFGLTTELTGEYKRYSHTFTCKQTGDYQGWRFGDWTDAVGYPGGSIYIGEIKIEEGNIPTAWRTAEGELTSRLRGTVENVPKEFFMSLNNTVLDTNSCYARLFRFTDFAIVKISCYIKGVTIEPWTHREVVSAPKAYFKDFSKFDYIKGKKEFSDLGRPYEVNFDITNSKIGIYCRGTKIEKEDLFLEIAGILYNQKGSEM